MIMTMTLIIFTLVHISCMFCAVVFCGVQLTVNEAAAQLCMRDMALLTRRDELFGLARQISREVTYKYTYRTSK